ncbi:MAG: phytoene desaturase family protein [Chloroflexota bacterium]
MATGYDAIVIGAGHNGLIAANYLADAGKRVLVVERRERVGGATVTEEVIPGFRASACSYVSGLLHPRILADLRPDQHGLTLYQTEMGEANLLRDGRSVFLYNDLSRTLREMERTMPGEGDRLVTFGLRLERFAALTGRWLLEPDPPTIDEVFRAFVDAGEEELWTEFFTLSVDDLLARGFTNDVLKGLLTFLAIVSVWGGPTTPGWAYVYGHHATGQYNGHMGQFAFPRGGMGSIAESLAARLRARGGGVRVGAPVEKVLVEKGVAAGIVLAGGEEIRATTILSNADPRQTYLRFLDPRTLPDPVVRQVSRFDQRGSMARVFLALDRLPDFVGLPKGEGPVHRGLTLLGAEVAAFQRVGDAQLAGRVPDDFPIEFIIQSVHDDTLAPAGKHILSTGIQQLPFDLAVTDWDAFKPEFERRVIGIMESYAPGITGSIIGTHTITPLDLEREYGLPGGNIFHGAMTLGQLFASRPIPGYASYRTPVPGLYLCGAGTHPGGGVIGAPGHNAAHAVLADAAAGGWRPRTGVRSAGSVRVPVAHRLMARPGLRRPALWVARRPGVSRIVERMGRR